MNSSWRLKREERPEYAYYKNVFSKEDCDNIITLGNNVITSTPLGTALVSGNNVAEPTIRKSKISWLLSNVEANRWLYEKLTVMVLDANNEYFNFDLHEIESLQFTQYEGQLGEFYTKHNDINRGRSIIRKLSFSIQLTDPSDYSGGQLLLHTGHYPIVGPTELGSMTFFPSYVLHEVTPVIAGIRHSLVGWVNGPHFK